MEKLIQEIMKHADEYAVESYELIPTGEMTAARTNKKLRIRKKWLKKYGMVPVYVKKKCKKIDVTPQLIIDFCIKNNYPLPDDFKVCMGMDGE